MNASGRIIALFALFLCLDLTGAGQTTSKEPQAASLRTPASRLSLTATVIDNKGRFVIGLQGENFQISIDKEPAKVVDFHDHDMPLSVGIVLDASASISDPGSRKAARVFVKSLQQALKVFTAVSDQSNEYFLLAFNNKPQLLLDWTSDSQAIMDKLELLQPKGITAFYDACYLAIDKVQHGRYSKRVLILISDGQDNNSNYSFSQVREALRESDVLLYSVNFSDENTAGSSLGMEGQRILKELSSVSGGMFFYKVEGVGLKLTDAASVFEIIATELRHQYTIAIMPQVSTGNTKWHRIKVKMKPAVDAPDEMKHLSARTREGFYVNHR